MSWKKYFHNRIKKVSVLIKKHQPKVIFMHTEPYWENFERAIKEVEGFDNVKFEIIK